MKPVPSELPDLIRPARQKLPVFLIGAAGGGVVPKHLRRVVLGLDAEADEPNVLSLELALDRPHRAEHLRTDVATPGDGERRDPYRAVELRRSAALASLIRERELRKVDACATRKEMWSGPNHVCRARGGCFRGRRTIAGATTDVRCSARKLERSRECHPQQRPVPAITVV